MMEDCRSICWLDHHLLIISIWGMCPFEAGLHVLPITVSLSVGMKRQESFSLHLHAFLASNIQCLFSSSKEKSILWSNSIQDHKNGYVRVSWSPLINGHETGNNERTRYYWWRKGLHPVKRFSLKTIKAACHEKGNKVWYDYTNSNINKSSSSSSSSSILGDFGEAEHDHHVETSCLVGIE